MDEAPSALTDLDAEIAAGYVRHACSSSGAMSCHALVVTHAGLSALGYAADDAATAAPTSPALPTPPSRGGYGPADLQSAYNIDPTGGAGEVVAVIESGDAPTLEADLAVYRAAYGLPPCTTANGCFRKLNQKGEAAPLPKVDPDWAEETSLDVDMVSALCPKCDILVIEAAKGGNSNDLDDAVNTAATLGAVAISNSYGGPEYKQELKDDGPAYDDHPGIFITASAGDSGYGTSDPAVFANVVSVGGTTLRRDASTTRGWSERVWTGTGSGCSTYVPKPAWQHDTGCSKRTDNDVAFDADPYTGVWVYDSTIDEGYVGWLVFGGTSVGAPAIAAIYALASNGLGNASSLYANAGDLFDITGGSDGKCSPAPTYLCTAEPGYDGPTGNGTPDGIGAF